MEFIFYFTGSFLECFSSNLNSVHAIKGFHVTKKVCYICMYFVLKIIYNSSQFFALLSVLNVAKKRCHAYHCFHFLLGWCLEDSKSTKYQFLNFISIRLLSKLLKQRKKWDTKHQRSGQTAIILSKVRQIDDLSG